jgi:hypothetical protein
MIAAGPAVMVTEFAHLDHTGARAAMCIGIPLGVPRITRSTSDWRLRVGDTVTQPADDRQAAKLRALAPLPAAQWRRHPQIALEIEDREFESRRHHRDDFLRLVIDDDPPADHTGVAAEAPLPERVADHGDVGPAAGDLCSRRRRGQSARSTPEHRERVWCHSIRLHAVGNHRHRSGWR